MGSLRDDGTMGPPDRERANHKILEASRSARRACKQVRIGYSKAMSYKTVEVELDHGRVHPSGAETLPAKAHALLTILTPAAAASPPKGSLADRVGHLAGIGRGEYTDLSTNKVHLNDFGR